MLERNPADQEPDVDAVTGTTTTGHEWDGIRELNTPLPRWWLWLFYATIVWAVGYWIVYPSWPLVSSYTKGAFGWQSRDAVVARSRRAQGAARPDGRQARRRHRCRRSRRIRQLLDFARAQARPAFAENCAPCHGAGGGGAKGYPNLNDDDWLWGGKLDEIAQTIRHGVRSGDAKARQGAACRPSAATACSSAPISTTSATYVRSLAGVCRRSQGRSRGRQEDLCRQLRGLPRRRPARANASSARRT